MNSDLLKHGQILGVTIASNQFEQSLAFYQRTLGYDLKELREICDQQAHLWGANCIRRSNCAILKPKQAENFFVRLIEQANNANFESGKHYGWGAFELTVNDVFALEKLMEDAGIEIIGAPKKIEGFDYFIPMQIRGIGGEILYLNQVLQNMPSLDLPISKDVSGEAFIAVVAANDMQRSIDWYVEKLSFQKGDKFKIVYGTINKNFNFPNTYQTELAMVVNERLPILEVDQYPDEAQFQESLGTLCNGNAIVSFAIDKKCLKSETDIQKMSLSSMEYCGHETAYLIGPNKEGIELIFI